MIHEGNARGSGIPSHGHADDAHRYRGRSSMFPRTAGWEVERTPRHHMVLSVLWPGSRHSHALCCDVDTPRPHRTCAVDLLHLCAGELSGRRLHLQRCQHAQNTVLAQVIAMFGIGAGSSLMAISLTPKLRTLLSLRSTRAAAQAYS